MQPLGIGQINQLLKNVPDWGLEDSGRCIMRVFEFPDFKKTVEFAEKIVPIAEAEEHHPELRIYDGNKIEIKLTTNSVQGLTEKDFKIASEIDKI